MKKKTAVASLAAALVAASLIVPLYAQSSPTETTASPAAGQPTEAEMKQMMELGKPGENHKALAQLAGTWSYDVQMWMAPGAPPMKSHGTGVRKSIMGGRFFVANFTSMMKMPGANGKMQEMEFKGMSVEGYDNVKQKFVATWCDNMGTSITLMEGSYDPASKTFTYNSEMEMMPGMKTKVREVVKIVDANHHRLEWYEDRGGQETKTMEIDYTRKS